MFHKTEEQFYAWLAGLLDGDGCFSIPLHLDQDGKSMHIGFSVTIGLKEKDSFVLEYIYNRLQIGHIYYSNKGTNVGKVTWQTTNTKDGIRVVELVLTYLVLKQSKALKFLEIAKWYESTKSRIYGKRDLNKKVRTNEEMKRVIKEAIGLNYDRQTIRYRNKKGLEYWYETIDRLYPNIEVANREA